MPSSSWKCASFSPARPAARSFRSRFRPTLAFHLLREGHKFCGCRSCSALSATRRQLVSPSTRYKGATDAQRHFALLLTGTVFFLMVDFPLRTDLLVLAEAATLHEFCGRHRSGAVVFRLRRCTGVSLKLSRRLRTLSTLNSDDRCWLRLSGKRSSMQRHFLLACFTRRSWPVHGKQRLHRCCGFLGAASSV